MYIEDVVIKHGGPELWQRIQNKPRGGRAGDDGFRMEHYFAIFKIAEIAASITNDDDISRRNNSDLTKYVPCLVDDLRIRDKMVVFYQLKWGRIPLKKVVKDVTDQSELDRIHGKPAVYGVVARTPRRISILRNIAKAQQIQLVPVLFPFGRKWLPFTEVQPSLRENLAIIAGSRCEQTLENLYKTISASWLEVDQCNVMEFINSIASINPSLFASRAVCSPAFDELQGLLASLDIEAYNFPRLKFVINGVQVVPPFQLSDDDIKDLASWLRAHPRSQRDVMLRLMELFL